MQRRPGDDASTSPFGGLPWRQCTALTPSKTCGSDNWSSDHNIRAPAVLAPIFDVAVALLRCQSRVVKFRVRGLRRRRRRNGSETGKHQRQIVHETTMTFPQVARGRPAPTSPNNDSLMKPAMRMRPQCAAGMRQVRARSARVAGTVVFDGCTCAGASASRPETVRAICRPAGIASR